MDGRHRYTPMIKMWEHAGFKCMLLRSEYMGHFCGYVGLPKSHPLWGKDYDNGLLAQMDVHGGITYADHGSGDDPYRLDPELWYVGFDCGHADDWAPYMDEPRYSSLGDRSSLHHWTVDEVIEETNKLAEQLKIENLVAKAIE